MKTLYLIRHAKSSWDDTDLPDIERPLNERGKRDAPRMGKRLKEKEIHPHLMLSSPAKRALSTCKRIAEVLGYDQQNIKTDRKLYHASEEEILQVIKGIKDKFDIIMLFGHNPGFNDFVDAMQDDLEIQNIPTCGVVAFKFDIASWQEVDWGKGKLLLFDYPKRSDD